jgi:hypothetical protein
MQTLSLVLDTVFAPARPLSRAVVWLYGRTFGDGETRVLLPVAEAFCWVKTGLYAAVALLLAYVLVTVGDTMLEQNDEPWVFPACVAVAYLNVVLSIAHYKAAKHLRELRVLPSKASQP